MVNYVADEFRTSQCDKCSCSMACRTFDGAIQDLECSIDCLSRNITSSDVFFVCASPYAQRAWLTFEELKVGSYVSCSWGKLLHSTCGHAAV